VATTTFSPALSAEPNTVMDALHDLDQPQHRLRCAVPSTVLLVVSANRTSPLSPEPQLALTVAVIVADCVALIASLEVLTTTEVE
jgi:hypothetical protein